MTHEELDALADSANAAFGPAEGYVGCLVRSYEPPILSFELASSVDAEAFKAHLEVMLSPYRHEIDPDNPTVVLEYR
jgi:hypothetical protein